MSKSSQANSATSAISLAAITAGAVAAAVVIMSIGSIVTIISIGSSINPGMQAATNMMDNNGIGGSNVAVLPVGLHSMNAGNFHKVKKHTSKNEKGFYMDAILREDTRTIAPVNNEQKEQPKLSIKGHHVFASLHLEEAKSILASA